MPNMLMTRRSFLSTTAVVTGGSVLAGLHPESLWAAAGALEADPYNDKTVARVYDPLVSSFVFGKNDINFYYRTFDVNRLESMLGTALRQITGAGTVDAAWRLIMPGMSSSSKVAVKININCAHELEGDHGAHWSSAPNTSPSMMAALTKSLDLAGIAQENITFFDRSRTFEKEWKADLAARCPKLVLKGKGEVAASRASISLSNGLTAVEIPAPVMEADYLINLHLLKKHSSGATGAMKNLLGLTGDVGQIAHKGGAREFHNSSLLKELSTHPEIRKRAVLCISEAVLGNRLPTQNMEPLQKTDAFPGGKASSLIVSRSPIFQDLVLLGFVNYEMTGDINKVCPDGNLGWLQNCVNLVPNFTSDCIGAAKLVDSPAGSLLPPKDLSFPSAKVKYISVAVQS